MADDLPVFPSNILSSYKKSNFYTIENEDICSEEEFEKLLGLLYQYPERSFYAFFKEKEALNEFLVNAEVFGIIIFKESTRNYFRHPEFERDYIRIDSSNLQFDWEEELLSFGDKYVRIEIQLSEKSKRQFTIQETKEVLKEKNILFARLSFYGIGIDLFNLIDRWMESLRKIKGFRSQK